MKITMACKKSAGLWLVLAGVFLMLSPVQAQQSAPGNTVPIRVIVTAQGRKGEEPPAITKEDVLVHQDKDRVPVFDWIPLQRENAGLELVILLDDASRTGLGGQLSDIRDFILAQPPSTSIAVAYASNASVIMAQNFTSDKALAAKALRIPLGNTGALSSPWLSLSDLISRWPPSNKRQEVLMISDGINRLRNVGLSDPDLDTAVEKAQKAGIVVHTIYASGVGRLSRSFNAVNFGQSKLAEITQGTGGNSYFEGTLTPIAFSPYLSDLAKILNRQYLLTFAANQGKKSRFYRLRVTTEVSGVELSTQSEVYVLAPGAKK
jgi:hypothetical protein